MESNPDEPAKEYLPEWKPVEGNLDESIGMEMCEDEPESHCTAPDVSVELRPEPEQSLESLNESPTQMAEMAPSNSESQIKENIITNETSHIENTLNQTWALYGPRATSGPLPILARPAWGNSWIKSQSQIGVIRCTQYNRTAFIIKATALFPDN